MTSKKKANNNETTEGDITESPPSAPGGYYQLLLPRMKEALPYVISAAQKVIDNKEKTGIYSYVVSAKELDILADELEEFVGVPQLWPTHLDEEELSPEDKKTRKNNQCALRNLLHFYIQSYHDINCVPEVNKPNLSIKKKIVEFQGPTILEQLDEAERYSDCLFFALPKTVRI